MSGQSGAVLWRNLLFCALTVTGCDRDDSVSNTQLDLSVLMDATVLLDKELKDSEVSVDAVVLTDAEVGDSAHGAQLYDRFCGFCHGSEGQGYLADNANALSNPNFLATATDEFLRIAIVEGRPGTPMSPWGTSNNGPLDDNDVTDIIAFIRSWQSDDQGALDVHDEAVEGSPMRGQAAYNVFCKSCHGAEGQGITAMSLNNPWFLESASDGFIRYAIEKGRPATAMPAYESQLSPQSIDDLVALIRSWARPVDGSSPEPFQVDLEMALINEDGLPADFDLRDGRFVAAQDVKTAIDAGRSLIIIDARPTADYLDSHIQGAISIPFYQIDDYVDQLPRAHFIVTYCGCPHAVSGQAADALIAAGFMRVAVLDEGYYFWQEQGWPLASGAPVR